MDDHADTVVIRDLRTNLASAVVDAALAGVTAFTFTLIVSTWVTGSDSADRPSIGVVALALAMSLVAIALILLLYSRLTVTSRGSVLTSQGPFRSRVIRASDVVKMTHKQVYSGRQCVELQSGDDTVPLYAVPWRQREIVHPLLPQDVADAAGYEHRVRCGWRHWAVVALPDGEGAWATFVARRMRPVYVKEGLERSEALSLAAAIAKDLTLGKGLPRGDGPSRNPATS